MAVLNQALTPAAERRTAAREGEGRIFVDQTHCSRHVTGIERIALELFSPAALAPLRLTPIKAESRLAMIARQFLGLPLAALQNHRAVVLCPGFPPSPLLTLFGERVLPYIHDVFLLTRARDLNFRAKAYMAGPFAFAVKRLPRFLVNSEHTERELRRHCRVDAEITLYRPCVRNVFGFTSTDRKGRPATLGELRLVTLGTVEPRKNLTAAVAILAALRAHGFPQARLDVIGRIGWGTEVSVLRSSPGVTLHGYQSPANVRALVEAADFLISTSHDEGLGLPLLEAQHGGIAVVAPTKPVFAEVLGRSGLLIDPDRPADAAARIAALARQPGWRERHANSALHNLVRWNASAENDRLAVIKLIGELAGARAV
ncbi:MAG: glycosyltransferase [Methylobacteriaceae bacterium]|nr:glycosyltransferase [Methylobacteriaceae bacterium]